MKPRWWVMKLLMVLYGFMLLVLTRWGYRQDPTLAELLLRPAWVLYGIFGLMEIGITLFYLGRRWTGTLTARRPRLGRIVEIGGVLVFVVPLTWAYIIGFHWLLRVL